jgi:hypothetical protein
MSDKEKRDFKIKVTKYPEVPKDATPTAGTGGSSVAAKFAVTTNSVTRQELERWRDVQEELRKISQHPDRMQAYERACRFALALLDENERLKEVNGELQSICICGCPLDAHENYGEDGMGCENPYHECVLISHAAFNIMEEIIRRLKAESVNSFAQCDSCGGLHPKTPNGTCGPCKEIERLKEENKELKWTLKAERDESGSIFELGKRQAAVVEAARNYVNSLHRDDFNALVEALAPLAGGGE